MISVAIEAKGGQLMREMLGVIQAVDEHDTERVTSRLHDFTTLLNEIIQILGRMADHCAPSVFFHHIRPFLAGGQNMASAGLPNGIFYDQGNGKGEWRQHSGGSNAQSSLIQAFDIFLGVQHSGRSEDGSSSSGGYLQVYPTHPVI